MPEFLSDSDVDSLEPLDDLNDMQVLIELLCGQTCPSPADLPKPQQDSVLAALEEAISHTRQSLTFEQLNEIMLLFGQRRVSAHFFDFFFLNKMPSDVSHLRRVVDAFSLKAGVSRFRGFALLCFGNFRFAYKELNDAVTPDSFLEHLRHWTADPIELEESYLQRDPPMLSILPEGSEVPRDKTWLLGYLSRTESWKDTAKLHVLEARMRGESFEERKAKINPRVRSHFEDYWTRLSSSLEEEWAPKLPELKERLKELTGGLDESTKSATRNTALYLTWDYLDIYVATSMRDRWHFTDAFDSVRAIWDDTEANLRELNLRVFDPTQSYEDCTIDKGLVEGLMLKRASLTIYLAQEGETLGKDSELAATLAQGKPVIAYVPRHDSDNELQALADELSTRPVEYYRKRLRSLWAGDFFDRHDNLKKVCNKLKAVGIELDDPRGVMDWALGELLDLFEKHNAVFSLISDESQVFQDENAQILTRGSLLMAAIEAVDADNRARTLKAVHPLAFQVHLETGVANGLLVARTPRECAQLVRGILTNGLEFRIDALQNESEILREATVLEERCTGSRYRVVTSNTILTNSFWNFYNL
jgi:hypothetical protein